MVTLVVLRGLDHYGIELVITVRIEAEADHAADLAHPIRSQGPAHLLDGSTIVPCVVG